MTLNCNENLIDLSTPKIMGILNLTPDSFYDGGKFKNKESILKQVAKMLQEGATFIDLGAYSSRPGAKEVTKQEELQRISPIIKLILEHYPQCIISIDTFRSSIAEACIKEGAALINDISAGHLDPNMLPTVAKLSVPYIAMHMKGNPQTMQKNTQYKNLLTEMTYYFSERIQQATTLGINDIIIDPGFGFSKTTEQNFELLQKMEVLQHIDRPILAGLSRKSMIYKTLDTNANNALNGTTALHMVCLQKGANILRVHDVKEAMECVNLFNQLNKAE